MVTAIAAVIVCNPLPPFIKHPLITRTLWGQSSRKYHCPLKPILNWRGRDPFNKGSRDNTAPPILKALSELFFFFFGGGGGGLILGGRDIMCIHMYIYIYIYNTYT